MKPYWFAPITFFLSTTFLFCGYFAGKAQTWHPPQGGGVGATMDRIASSEPSWHFYPAGQSGLAAGFYVTSKPRDPEELRALPRAGEALDRWPGVVLVTPRTPHASSTSQPYEIRVGDFVLFGDAEMTAKVAATLSR